MPDGDNTARKAALAAMLAVWNDRVVGGVQASPQTHCEALLDAALTGLNSDTDAGEKGWTPWPGLHVRASKLPDRDDLALEVWRRNDHDGWDYTVLLPPDVVDARLAMIRAAVPLVHERRNGWCDACGGTGRDGVDHIDVVSSKTCEPVPCPSFDEVRMALVPRMDAPTVADLRQAGAAIYRFGDTFWSLRDGAVVVIDLAGNVVDIHG